MQDAEQKKKKKKSDRIVGLSFFGMLFSGCPK